MVDVVLKQENVDVSISDGDNIDVVLQEDDLIVSISEKEMVTVYDSPNIDYSISITDSVGTRDHDQLTNRDLANQHPINAITGLQDELDNKADKTDLDEYVPYTGATQDVNIAGNDFTADSGIFKGILSTEKESGIPSTANSLLNIRDTASNIGFQMGASADGGWIRAVDVLVSVNADLILQPNGTKTIAGGDLDVGGDVSFLDDKKVILGTGNDTSISFDGTNTQFTSTGQFVFDNGIQTPYLDLDTTAGNPTSKEGRTWWNSDVKTLNVDTGDDSVLQVGQESYLPYELGCNETGATIPNGSAVYLSSDGSKIVIKLANSKDPDVVNKVVGITTQDIEDGECGFVNTYGLLRGVDTSSYALSDVLYLSPDVDGGLTAIQPENGNYIIPMAKATKIGVDGELFVRYLDVRDPKDIKKATGFPNQNASVKESDASFVNSTRTFTLAPNTADGYDSFYVWQLGTKYLFDSALNLVIPDEEGVYFIYIDDGVLAYLKNPSGGDTDALIREKVLVAQLYWNAEDGEAVLVGDERHGHVMSSDTHAYLHYTQGAKWLSGLALGDIEADESGNDDSHAQFSITMGVTTDEDLINISIGTGSTVGLPIFWLKGTEKNLRREVQSGFSVLTDITAGVDTTGRLVYNNITTGTLETITNNDFVLCHVFATNSKQDPVIAFIGQNDYTTRGNARAGANTEIGTILTSYPNEELVPIATVIFQTGNGKSNQVKAETVSTDEGEDYVDWRTTELKSGAVPSDHSNLAGLANDDHLQYSLVDGTRAFTGVVGGITPTADTHLATKAYVDDNAGGGFTRDVLFSGSVGVSTITLSQDINDYMFLEFTGSVAGVIDMAIMNTVETFKNFNAVTRVLINAGFIVDFEYTSDTSISIVQVAGGATLTKVVGVK